ncbi:relaxase/mobilization nuclease [Streptomyces sp. NPDC093249]|uniref:relaxase/mobilization nuclease n=1 Tax=unclassified Streptomyces TaxID=2593676 RepID=UPI003450CF0C
MIIHIHRRAADAGPVLADALGEPLTFDNALATGTIVAHVPGLGAFPDDHDPASWTAADWAEHVNGPLIEHPFAVSPDQERRAVVHLTVRLAPEDRELNGPDWSEVAFRIARAAGIEIPGDVQGCRLIALRAQPGRLDLIANLIRHDGTWQRQPSDLPRRLAFEARRLESDLGLMTPGAHAATPPLPDTARGTVAQLAPLTDVTGPLASARRVIELQAQLLVGHPHAHLRSAGHRLEWTARRLLDLDRDLAATVTELSHPPTASAPDPSSRLPAHRTAARAGSRP